MGFLSSTQFVRPDGLVVAQSVKPCYLTGDADLFGLGIRIAFYLQYLTVYLALVYGMRLRAKAKPLDPDAPGHPTGTELRHQRREQKECGKLLIKIDSDLRNLRISLTILALVIFLALCIGSTGDTTLSILDWTMALLIVLFGSAIAGFPVLERQIVESYGKISAAVTQFRLDYIVRMHMDTKQKEQWALQRLVETQRQRYFLASAMSDLEAHDALVRAEGVRRIRRLLEDRNRYDAGAAGQTRDQLEEEARHITEVIHANRWRTEYDLRALSTQLEQNRERLLQGNTDLEEQKKLLEDLAKHKDEAEIQEIAALCYMEARHEEGMVEKMSTGFLLLSWAIYFAAMPWLYFRGLYDGTRPGVCDVRVPLFFYPLTIYNRGFVIVLRISSVLGIILAAILLVQAILYFIQGYKYTKDALHFDQDEDDGIEQGDASISETTRSDEPEEIKALRAQMQAVQAEFEKRVRDPIPKELANGLRLYVIFVIPLYITTTIVLAELTLAVNDVHIPTIQSTGQLIALVVALSQFIVTAYHILCGLWFEHKLRKMKPDPPIPATVSSTPKTELTRETVAPTDHTMTAAT
ncbi:hypothetical protein QBC39DRAFT_178002 [Podospora conica]|nr:hypothetical protein QBC39DRAFT_178002 [Schizothecium conicum]